MAPSFKLLEVKADSDFPQISTIIWDAFEHPLNPFHRIMFYLASPSPSYCSLAMKITTERLLARHKGDASSHWIKVNDVSTEKMVACTTWNFHERNPYAGHWELPVADWWLEGEGRRFATKFLRQCVEHNPVLFDKPHAYLNISATAPAFQRRGAGGMMVEWGLKWADEMGDESFTEATEMGKPLYEHYGFVVVKNIRVDEESMAVEDPSEEWKELEKRLLPCVQYVMRRPVGGKSKEG